jgi:UDP-3-O-[3-hydroxymyristoyl] glucosamine N-acyltransferase
VPELIGQAPLAGLSVGELAALLGARLVGEGTGRILRPAGLAEAGPDAVSLFQDARYEAAFAASSAGAILVPEKFAGAHPRAALLYCADPNAAFSAAIERFLPPPPSPPRGIDPRAAIAPTAKVHASASVGAFVVVEAEAEVAADAVLYPGVVLGVGARVGEGAILYPGVVLYAGALVGARTILHSGVVLGADGFGFDWRGRGWVKVPQRGGVEVGSDCEVGANTTIDRARLGVTRIGRGVKLDNLVMIGHNASVGDHGLICGQAGVAGSAHLDPGVVMGAQSGVAGHVRLTSGVRLAGRGGATTNLEEPGDWFGFPARPHKEALRRMAAPQQVERLRAKIKDLEQRLEALEQRLRSGTGQPENPA